MKTMQAFFMIISSLKSNKMRAFLTMLGMIIGVAAVIAMISIMDGMISYTMGEFSDMGADTISVQLTGKGSRQLTSDDFYEFVETHKENFKAVSPSATIGANLRREELLKKDMMIFGVNEYYAKINGLELEQGRFLSYADMKARSKVCVIGSYIRNEFYPGEDPVGQTLSIGNDEYTVVGVLKEKNKSEEYSQDSYVYAPYVRIIRQSGCAEPNNFVLEMGDSDQSMEDQQELEL